MFETRLQEIKKKLKEEKADAVLISSVSNITYLTGYTNFSKEEREAYIFIGKNFAYIITDGRYTEAIKREVPHLTLFERGNGIFEDLLKKHKNEIKQLGIEEDNLTVSEYKFIKKHFNKLKHLSVSNLRSIKIDEEIKKIEEACKLGDLAFKHILKKIKSGVTEKEIAHELESFIKDKGVQFSFPPIVAFGKNSAIPHHQTGQTKLEKGQNVLLDFGVKFENYCSDMTRTIFFGKSSKKQQDMYKVVLETQKRAVDFLNSSIKSGKKIKAAQVDKVARGYIKSKGYPNLPHSLGHGIGLEVHEHPFISEKSKEVLKEGMVFSIEPGIYIPDFGGVRIEDLYVLKGGGFKRLTCTAKNLLSF